jgi:hypothetical protein
VWPLSAPLPYGSNKHGCMDKEEFHWICGVMRGWFSAKLGWKISDGPQQSAKLNMWPLSAPGT